MNTPSAPDKPERLADTVKAGPGGAMTDEVGIVTGDLTVATTLQPGGRAALTVQYADAEDWYHLTGSPAPLPPAGLAALHCDVLKRIRAGGGAQAPS
ncbi:hypothetical protein QQY24_31750 [Streptomyces sp. TG1A-8]|uniref:hypothetical protein n=1 Tax=Streptomyces sp. TG1A-8 TaxID=3051385 RepID=UPI00265B78EF|nr:hypothetical protein [Streptomyces sp. TG1A-8]MDO0929702.1 hypothetical protein [Streptomyces sp. TG1A-8]